MQTILKSKIGAYAICALLFIGLSSLMCMADDTDIYKPEVKHNVMILLDTSESMNFGIYDDGIDYHAFYRYIVENNEGWQSSPCDVIAGGCGTSAYFYPTSRARGRTKIYLIFGNIGYANGLTGDPADPSYLWYAGWETDTGTYLNSAGELEDVNGKKPGESGYLGRVGTVVDGTTGETMVTLDGQRLPNNKDMPLHDWQDFPDGSRVDKGFAGMIRAPGYLFSGYFFQFGANWFNAALPVTDTTSRYTSNPDNAWINGGRHTDFFFITGNWLNMQMVYNLQAEVKNNQWEWAWTVSTYPAANYTPSVSYNLTSPSYPSDYPYNYDSQQDGSVNYLIYNGEASKIRLHFDALTLADGDRIEFYDEFGDLNSAITSMPTDGWTNWITGRSILVRFVTDNDDATVASGWEVDAYQYESKSDYEMFSRLEAATDAMIDVVETTRGKVNWGYMTFDRKGNADGAQSPPQLPINPSFSDDLHRSALVNQLEKTKSEGGAGGTPLGEALQDVFIYFNSHINQIHRDCNKNFVIVLTDGFPDNDDEWDRIDSSINFATDASLHDDPPHQYTQDPFQYSAPIPNDYFDDVAKYLYVHSYLDHSEIDEADRRDSADNIAVHNIGFTIDSPMLEHASELGGGLYLTAFSKAQLVNAFYSLGLVIAEYTSYTAPVVSVDEANRVQSGDKLYMALFKPNQAEQWVGNLKKYGLTFGVMANCNREAEWYVIDKTGKEATQCDGEMIEEASSFWSTENDGGEVEKGGAGQIMYNSIPPVFSDKITSSNADFRDIYTYVDDTFVKVGTDTLTKQHFGVNQNSDRDKIVNFIYGYTYDAYDGTGGTTDGAPKFRRSWPLGPIIHSTPVLLDYLDSSGNLVKRLIAVGANDGMLHVFDDNDGSEVFAFIPPGVLNYMKDFDPATGNTKVYTVDGSPTLAYKSNGDLLLIFGLRRGGRAYYALNVTSSDPSSWSFAWEITTSTTGMSELGYSMPTPRQAKIKTGSSSYKNILIIPGGYDPVSEDRNTDDNTVDYELTDSHEDTMGRGIYVIDMDTGLPLDGSYFSGGSQFAWPDSGTPDDPISRMKYCFAADPTVVLDTEGVLLAAYVADLYGQVWKLRYDTTANQFKLNLIFKVNPLTDQASAYENRSSFLSWESGDSDPRGGISFITDNQGDVTNPRKTFFSPDVSYAGNCYTDIPVLFMGTGDREFPTFIGSTQGQTDNTVKNGIYSFYDAQAYYEIVLGQTYSNDNYFTEKDLLNVTCGALEPDVELSGNETDNVQIKSNIEKFLSEEAKGWYLLFSKLDGCPNSGEDSSADHAGEKAISPVNLFAKVVYVPTYQPASEGDGDACTYDGIARLFALEYCNGNAAYSFFEENDSDEDVSGTIEEGEKEYERRDRYMSVGKHIPSGVSVVIREGKAAGFMSVGGKIAPIPGIKGPTGMIPFYWREIF